MAAGQLSRADYVEPRALDIMRDLEPQLTAAGRQDRRAARRCWRLVGGHGVRPQWALNLAS